MKPSHASMVAAAAAVAAAATGNGAHAFVLSQPRVLTSRTTISTCSKTDTCLTPGDYTRGCSSRNTRGGEPLSIMHMGEGEGAGAVGGGDEEEARQWESVAGERRTSRWGGLRRALARGAASLAVLTCGATALSGATAGLQQRTGTTIPGAMATAGASVFKPFNKRTLEEKISTVPVFMVTNLKGSPFLSPSRVPGQQLAVFFTNYDDAEAMLQEMAQNRLYAKEARVLVLSMEKAYGMVREGPRGTGYANADGEEEVMAFKFEADTSSVPKARRLGIKLDPAASSVGVPVFYAEGLQVKKDGQLVKPLFMDPEDLLNAWKKAAKQDSTMPAEPPVQVFNLPEILIGMEVTEELRDFGFFPSAKSMRIVNDSRSFVERKKAKLGRMWAF